jgi:peptide/nickel transport system substrate-binding protein
MVSPPDKNGYDVLPQVVASTNGSTVAFRSYGAFAGRAGPTLGGYSLARVRRVGAKKLGGAAAVLTVLSVLWAPFSAAQAPVIPEQGLRPLRAASYSFPDYMDPAISYTLEGWTAMYDTYIPLLTYRHASGRAGAELVPGLAESLPSISNGGRTYTLFLRPGLKYSNGQPVKASDFEFAVERMFRLNSGGSVFFTDIVGAERFELGRRRSITGILTDDKTGKIVIHLIRPRGSFSDELALMFVAPVPPDTPLSDQSADPPPATGPYVITSSKPGRGWSYVRNPQWAANNAALMSDIPSGHVDSIQVSVIRDGSAQVHMVEQGNLDWMLGSPPADRLAEVQSRYQGTQFRSEPTLSTYYFWMNTARAPFNDLRVRRAVNYAVDPLALRRIYAGQLSPTHQILPPGMPGYEGFDLYPHRLARARRMVEKANPSDRHITVWTDTESPNQKAGEYYAGVLRKLGFHANLKVLNADNYFTIIGNRATPNLDTGWANWYEDYPHPNDFFQPMLAGASILPTYNANFANIAIPALNKEIARLGEKQLGPGLEKAYARLDRGYMLRAPWAPYGNRLLSTFVSSSIDLDRMIWNPTFGVDLTSLQFK